MEDLIQQQHQFRALEEESDEKDALSIFSAVMSNVLLFFLIFGLSATVEVKNLRHQLTNKFAIFTGVAMQFLIMPLLGFSSVFMLRESGFTQAMGISLLVVTASPGGSYSNWWCSLFNAELALSVAMTSVSSILSIALLPANLFLYSWLSYSVIAEPEDGVEVNLLQALDFRAIFISLGVVLGAIFSGLYVGYKYDDAKFHERVNQFGSVSGLLLILFSAFLGSGAGGADTKIWSLDWAFYVGTAFPCLVGMALANIISRGFRLTPPETVAISIECCYQNTAIATSVAVTMYTDPNLRAEAVSVPLFYGLCEAFIIGVYCVCVWKMGWTKAPADENICVVMTKTYEVEESGDDIPRRSSWLADLFVPGEEGGQDGATATKADSKAKGSDPRGRFYSADVTVATTVVSPPGTPDTSLEAIQKDSSKIVDLEAPSMKVDSAQKKIEVVHEIDETQSGEQEETEKLKISNSDEHHA